MVRGWTGEPRRHALAARGIPTGMTPMGVERRGRGHNWGAGPRLWHKTTRGRAKTILEHGFELSKRGSGGRGGESDIMGVSLGGKGYTYSDEFLAYDLGVDESEIVTLSVVADIENLYETDEYSEWRRRGLTPQEAREEMIDRGYDAVRFSSGEVVVLKPELITVQEVLDV